MYYLITVIDNKKAMCIWSVQMSALNRFRGSSNENHSVAAIKKRELLKNSTKMSCVEMVRKVMRIVAVYHQIFVFVIASNKHQRMAVNRI